MHSGSHVSVRGGDDPRQKIKSSSTILANSGPATVHLFKAAEFSVSPAAPSLPSIYRFMGMIQRYVYVIAWARGQLRINFTSIFKVFTKLPESRSDEGNLENFENTSEINP